jgi:4-amino-4-deoxychorismate lyase
MTIKSVINGIDTNSLPVSDRGLHYGDGLFETMLILNGRPQLWDAHVRRLLDGCQRLAIRPPDVQTLHSEALQLSRGQNKAVLKLIITRGSGGRGYRPLKPDQAPEPTRILQLHPYPDYPPHYWQDGIHLRRCQTPVSGHPMLAGIKHLNRIENVLARSEWDDESIAEGIMTDQSGRWIEGIMSNMFLVRDGTLYTPDLSRCGVAGIMRQTVLGKAAELNIVTHIQPIDPEFAARADELFVTNSLIGIWPVQNFEGKIYGSGPITTQLRQSLLCFRHD